MYGVSNYLDISTSHITEQTLTSKSVYKIADYAEGAFFWVDEDLPAHLPKDLYDVMRHALSLKCYIIRFDADGFEFPELPTYDW